MLITHIYISGLSTHKALSPVFQSSICFQFHQRIIALKANVSRSRKFHLLSISPWLINAKRVLSQAVIQSNTQFPFFFLFLLVRLDDRQLLGIESCVAFVAKASPLCLHRYRVPHLRNKHFLCCLIEFDIEEGEDEHSINRDVNGCVN